MQYSPSLPISLLAAAASCAAKVPSPEAPPISRPQSPAYHSSVVQPDDEDIRECDEDVDGFLKAAREDIHFQCDTERIQLAIGQIMLRCGEMFTPMRAEMIRKAIARNFGRPGIDGNCQLEEYECGSAISSARHDIRDFARTCTVDILTKIGQESLPEMTRACSTAGGRQFPPQESAVYQELQLARLKCAVDANSNKLGIEPKNQSLRNK